MEETIRQYIELADILRQYDLSEFPYEEQAKIVVAQTELVVEIAKFVSVVKPIVAKKNA